MYNFLSFDQLYFIFDKNIWKYILEKVKLFYIDQSVHIFSKNQNRTSKYIITTEYNGYFSGNDIR